MTIFEEHWNEDALELFRDCAFTRRLAHDFNIALLEMDLILVNPAEESCPLCCLDTVLYEQHSDARG